MNIQSLPWLKFAHDEYLVSEFKAQANAFAKAAYLDLLCFAMKQRPALSIPNDDNVLAGWASVTIECWQQIKDLVLSQFRLNQDDNRYYSPMLVELYSDSERQQQAEPSQPKAKAPRKAMTPAERVAKHRAKQAANNDVTAEVTACNAECNEISHDVTPNTVTCNADVTASNEKTLHLGGKGGDLELRTEKEDKKTVVVVREPVQQTPSPTTTTKFSMFFDFQIQTANVDLLMQKLNVAPSKNTADNLNNFIAHYLGSTYKNSQADWELHYVKWIKRQKDAPVASVATPETMPNKTPAPLMIVDVKPLWETIAEQKAERQALPPKDPQKLAAADSAFSLMKKTLGLKAA